VRFDDQARVARHDVDDRLARRDDAAGGREFQVDHVAGDRRRDHLAA
jgi:hypothetical protein